jgi:hypothetical protein
VFVEACDAVVVQPFLPPAALRGVPHVHTPPPPPTETAAAAAIVRQQEYDSVHQAGLYLPDLGAISDNDDSVVGDVDIGRYECNLQQNVGCAAAARVRLGFRVTPACNCSESELFQHMSLRLPLPSAGSDNEDSASAHSQFHSDKGR